MFDPYRIAAWWVGMTIGVPMLAVELANEVWGAKPAPLPARPPAEPLRLPRSAADFHARFEVDAIEEIRDEMVAVQGAKLAQSDNPLTRLSGQRMVAKVAAKRARKGKA